MRAYSLQKLASCLALALLLQASAVAQVIESESGEAGHDGSAERRLQACLDASSSRVGKFRFSPDTDDLVRADFIHESDDGSYLFVAESNWDGYGETRFNGFSKQRRPKPLKKNEAMVRVVSLKSGAEQQRIACGPATNISSLTYSGTTGYVAAISENAISRTTSQQFGAPLSGNTLTIFNMNTNERLLQETRGSWVQAVLSSDSRFLLLYDRETLNVFEFPEVLSTADLKEPRWSRSGGYNTGISARLFPNRNWFLLPIAPDGNRSPIVELARFSDGNSWEPISSLKQGVRDVGLISSIDFSSNGELLAIAREANHTDSSILSIVDVKQGKEIQAIEADSRIKNTTARPTAMRFVNLDKEIVIAWRLEKTGKPLMGHVQRTLEHFSERWSLGGGKKLHSSELNGEALQIVRNGKYIVTRPAEGSVDVSDLGTGLPLMRVYLFHSESKWLVESIDGFFDADEDTLSSDADVFEKLQLKHDSQKIEEILSLVFTH